MRSVWIVVATILCFASPGRAQWQFWTTSSTGATVRVLDPLPAETPAPVIVFLHGSGASAADWQGLVEPLAESLGVVVMLPQAVSSIGFGVGEDETTVQEALAILRDARAVDEQRISLSGHSAGGAFALALAYRTSSRFNAVFTLSSPYRQLLGVEDPDYTAPLRLYYGTDDPNYLSSYPALSQLLDRLDIPWQEQISPGYGHSSWPAPTLEDGFRFLLAARYGDPGPCRPDADTLCLRELRFQVRASWTDFEGTTGTAGVATARSSDSGLLWFFRPENWEVMVKVLDGCAVNDHYWVLSSASTNVAYSLEIVDLASGQEWSYQNPAGLLSPAHADIEAFAACP